MEKRVSHFYDELVTLIFIMKIPKRAEEEYVRRLKGEKREKNRVIFENETKFEVLNTMGGQLW